MALDWGWGRDQTETPLLREVCRRLTGYFDGVAADFSDFPVCPAGTAYRRRVWAALRHIPFGSTKTYRDLAKEVGGSPRSVGQANAANPIPILIPCHRVVGVGTPGGYSGQGGVASKLHLIELERCA